MSVEIPAAVLDALQPYEAGCWSLESHGDTAFVVKMPALQLGEAWNARMLHRFQLARDLAPCVVRLQLEVRVAPVATCFTVLWNCADARQLGDLERLVLQDQIDFYFFDSATQYHFTRRVGLLPDEATRLAGVIDLVKQYLGHLPWLLRDAERDRVQEIMEERL